VLFLFLPYLTARLYVTGRQNQSPRLGLYSVLYLVSFLVSQSFLAFDVVMTFDYPWINTLFGGYFMVEALLGGIAFAAILAGFFTRRANQTYGSSFKDLALMLGGFALLWAGLFFSQYLVIWYGNLPEEVSYLTIRLSSPLMTPRAAPAPLKVCGVMTGWC
jgi:hypothetical protein